VDRTANQASQPDHAEPAQGAPGRLALPLLLLLFAGSGCSALIYEIVWCQLLQLVIGSTAVSLGVLLGTFMGGMCLGSLLLPRLISPRRHPFRVYALLELALGALGVGVLFGMPLVDEVYVAAAGHGMPAILLRGAVCAACLLVPTALMGATLPAIARWVKATPQGVSWLGLFYGGNIAGAVFGCLLAGFYLLRVHDMATATYVAAGLNGVVALLGIALAALTPHRPPALEETEDRGSRIEDRKTETGDPRSSILDPRSSARGNWPVYLTAAISGACALAAEVVWTRQLSLMLGATVYTFSIILAVFLVGLGAGSSVGSLLARSSRRPRLVLGGCQLLLAAAIAWTALMVAKSLPYWPIKPSISPSPWYLFQLDLARCLWAVFPATFLWGASFPLALAAAADEGQDPGRLVGAMYAANTAGAIVGAVGASLLLIPWLGTQDAQRVLIGLSTLAALLMLVPGFGPARAGRGFPERAETAERRPVSAVLRLAGALLVATGLAAPAVFLAWKVPPLPWEVVAFGRSLLEYNDTWNKLYVGEGMNSSIAVTEWGGQRNFHVSGKVEASSEPHDMRLQRMLGHIPALLHPRPRSVLVVGCGAGVTAGSFLVHPGTERVVICEIEPLVPQKVAPYFTEENYDVVHDKRVEIIYDDARHYVLTTSEKFDIITSDPIHPWVKGSATLYTKEYFELVKSRLNPGGLVTQWVPLYESNLAVVKSEIATFFEVFPHGTIWCNPKNGGGYDVVLLGQVEPLKIYPDRLLERLKRPDHAKVARSLKDVGFNNIVGLLGTYGGRAEDLREWLTGAQINRDRNLRLQYLAGMELNQYLSNFIYEEIMVRRRYPEDLFLGSGSASMAVKMALPPYVPGKVEPGFGKKE
jgi:spermidine synthase